MKTVDELINRREKLLEEIEELEDNLDLIQTKIDINKEIIKNIDEKVDETKIILPYIKRIRRCKF